MPYRKSVPSLEGMCLNTVTTNFVALKHKLADQPSEIIGMIYERMMSRKFWIPLLSPEIFIHSGTNSLRSVENFGLSIDVVLDKIGAVCTNLLILEVNLTSFTNSHPHRDIRLQSVAKMLADLPRLQHLSMSVHCTDQFVAAIGKNCPQLTKLSITDLSRVVDAGFRPLIGCTKLTFLNLYRSRLTVDVCLFLLDELRLLKEFTVRIPWSEIIVALKRRSNPKSRTYLLEKMYHCFNQEDIMFVNTTFPNLRKLSIGKMHVNFDSVMCSYNINVLPRLTTLRLYNIGDEVSELQIKTLLQQCENLEVLIVVDCAVLTDNLILDLAESNGFKHLKVLKLIRCGSVSLVSIMRLVEMRSPLKKVMWKHCANMRDSDCDSIKSYAKNHNLDLKFGLISEGSW